VTAAPSPGVNLEFKAHIDDPAAAASALAGLGARRVALVHQRDTYFAVGAGRLKLREQDGAAELIAYERPNVTVDRWSRYTRTPIADPAAALVALTAEHRLRGVVTKVRRVWLYENTRIHIDEVDGLGKFIEIEVVDPPSMGAARNRLTHLLRALALDPAAAIGGSYIDLMEQTDRDRS
jgi:predicted adenylyl cyclase CyaB